MSRRNIELLLLIIASPIVIVLFSMMVVTGGQELSVNTLGVPLGIFGAFVVAHLAVRKLAPAADPAILPIAFALSGIGIAFVTRIVPDLAVRQVMWLFAGIVVMILVLAFVRNLDKLANYKYTLMIAGILLLLSPMLPVIGYESGGGQLWLQVGSFKFQPGELAKILIVFFIAAYLAANREMLSVFTWKVGPVHLPSLPTLLPLIIMWALAFVVVVLEKDLGLALVLFSVFVIMLYVATGKKMYLVVSIALAAIAAVALYGMMGHVRTRVSIWLDPFAAAQGGGFQLVQSLFSLADGDLFGTGIGRGMGGGPVDAGGIPVAESDFIFPVIAEETGLMGAAGVLLLYLCFAIRGVVTAARAKSDVSSFTAVGLTSIIVLQAFIIVGGVTRLIPLTGITLPFVSQGGSSLIASFMIVGFLLRCGDEGTGVDSEIQRTGAIGVHGADSVLGRVALGKRLTGAMLMYSLLFAVLVANLTYIMIIKAPEYQNMPSNNHTIAREAKMERGTISTEDGVVLARSVRQDDGTYKREYPAGTLAAHIVGYSSQKFGTAGIEAAYNDTLRGQQNFASFTDVVNSLAGIQTKGNDVTLSIDSRIQESAQAALEGQVGACVVMDPETGAVLGMASSPTFNAADYEALLSQSTDSNSSELYNRATQALYAPGSTFKMVSLAAALQDGVATPTTEYDAPGEMEIGNAPVTNVKKRDYGRITLEQATWYSSNTVFGQVGVQIGADLLVQMAMNFGFNETIKFDLPLAMSLMPDPDEMTEWETAWAACGEPVGEHESPAGPQATVLEMCMVGSAIANEGALMQPYLVDGVYNANGERSFSAAPVKLKQAIDKETAARVMTVLEGVVTEGTGTRAAIEGVKVAGKTGTSERGDGDTDSWFVGMAPAEDPKVVVAINLERAESGSGAAAAHDVLKTALEVVGAL
ncbi:FtsW/RodA/SpoVE family cell cycle protein [Adlercreutzia mucosicola]|uniref:FtsW/RodA/SpoVE family cell cycle protein n=1 Tax=Adlercreutzia mucosicola TaxID=580026 RepID=UPI002B2497A1|nr:FtsW/RodA/SpoVE family cell cycle protein [Adlercreutzia mucosicola]MEB1813101.1 FtsW/RodA/SpoVE family cell cycle protein [Adlercreutzia mucosicola]